MSDLFKSNGKEIKLKFRDLKDVERIFRYMANHEYMAPPQDLLVK